MIYVYLSVALIGTVAAQTLLKKGVMIVGHLPSNMGDIIPFLIKAFTNPYVICAMASLVIASVAWILTVSGDKELSYIYPIMALSYIIVVLLATWLFNEDVSLLRWVGVIIVTIGVSCVVVS